MLGNDVVDLLDVDARPETFRRRFDERVFAADERRAIADDASRSPSPPRPQAPSPAAGPHALRWAHWGAKEAAYKLIRQIDPGFVFSPARLVARFEPSPRPIPTPIRMSAQTPTEVAPVAPASFERRGHLEVVPGSSALPAPLVAAVSLRSFETADFVHVVALPVDGDWSAVTLGVEAMTPATTAASSGAPGVEHDAARNVEAERPVAPGAARVAEAGRASAAVRRLARQVLARALEVEAERLAIGRRGRIPTVELDGRTLPISLSLSHHGRFVAFAAAPRGCASLRAAASRRGPDGATGPIDEKAFAALRGQRGSSRLRIASVRRTSGEGGGPFASADTAWMVG